MSWLTSQYGITYNNISSNFRDIISVATEIFNQSALCDSSFERFPNWKIDFKFVSFLIKKSDRFRQPFLQKLARYLAQFMINSGKKTCFKISYSNKL